MAIDKKKLFKVADDLGRLSGSLSRALLDKTIETAKTKGEVAKRFETSFSKSMNAGADWAGAQAAKYEAAAALKNKALSSSSPKTIEGNSPTHTTRPEKALLFCKWKNCNSDALENGDFCAIHQREQDQFKARHCGNKMQHATLEVAQLHAADLSAKKSMNYTAYSCRFCGSFHTGTSKLGQTYEY